MMKSLASVGASGTSSHSCFTSWCFLKYLGSYGNEASLQKISWDLGILKGDINDIVMRVSQAILRLQNKVIRWLDEEERKQIGSRIKQAHGFVNCVGLIDGTLFPSAFVPTLNYEDSRKKVTMQLKVCLFVMILWRLLWLKWDGLVAYTTTGFGRTVMFTCQRKVFHQQGVSAWWFGLFHIYSYGSQI